MSWLNNICVKKPHNCLHKDTCPPGSDCCAEKNGKIGTCVAKGSCNTKTGHPTLQTPNKCPTENYIEGYSGENGDICNCESWKWGLIFTALIALILGVGFIHLSMKRRK